MAKIRCHQFLFVLLIGAFICVRSIKSDLITTYREFKVVKTPPDADRDNNSNRDVSFYVEADEHLEKLKSQAEELRDTYNELIKNAFGRELNRNRTAITTPTTTTTPKTPSKTTKDSRRDSEYSSEVVGGTRKAAADWVRAAINPMLLSDNTTTTDNTNKTAETSSEKIKTKLNLK